MFISKFLSDANFGLASFTVLVYSMINYNNKIDRFTNNDGDRSNSYDKGADSFNITIWITPDMHNIRPAEAFNLARTVNFLCFSTLLFVRNTL